MKPICVLLFCVFVTQHGFSAADSTKAHFEPDLISIESEAVNITIQFRGNKGGFSNYTIQVKNNSTDTIGFATDRFEDVEDKEKDITLCVFYLLDADYLHDPHKYVDPIHPGSTYIRQIAVKKHRWYEFHLEMLVTHFNMNVKSNDTVAVPMDAPGKVISCSTGYICGMLPCIPSECGTYYSISNK